jgi:TRAP-type mannitol/chloroaromatic compound transport system permease large subunit
MMEFIAQNMAPIMFVSLIIFLLLGYPVAFSLAANGLLFFIIGVELAPCPAAPSTYPGRCSTHCPTVSGG